MTHLALAIETLMTILGLSHAQPAPTPQPVPVVQQAPVAPSTVNVLGFQAPAGTVLRVETDPHTCGRDVDYHGEGLVAWGNQDTYEVCIPEIMLTEQVVAHELSHLWQKEFGQEHSETVPEMHKELGASCVVAQLFPDTPEHHGIGSWTTEGTPECGHPVVAERTAQIIQAMS